jgi:hypothetical protein
MLSYRSIDFLLILKAASLDYLTFLAFEKLVVWDGQLLAGRLKSFIVLTVLLVCFEFSSVTPS